MNAKPTNESRLLIVGEQQWWIEAEYRNNICIKHNSSLYDISQHDNKITWKIFSITGLFGGHISITITAGVFHSTFFLWSLCLCNLVHCIISLRFIRNTVPFCCLSCPWCRILGRRFEQKCFKCLARPQVRRGYTVRGCTEVTHGLVLV